MKNLSRKEINQLTKQGCSAHDWNLVRVSPDLDLSQIINVRFSGWVEICQGVQLRNIKGGIGGCKVCDNAIIENVSSLTFDPEANHGVGTMVAVLDETGSRSVCIYPGLSSQIATLMAREPRWLKQNLDLSLREFLESRETPAEVGENSVIRNCGTLTNVSIGREVVVEGASKLSNGSIINNAGPGKAFTYVGNDVEAENFIIEDARVESRSTLINCYLGQGVVIARGFTAHDSLFFANCSLENGEATSLLAGPYTVSMHKGTLLIGCQTSFMNAGSLSNQSNHMYKLGPVHWGLLERGVKTSSGSYLMLGAKIGAFSLLMGSHKTHPDSSEFPFSYLFGDERGATVVVPGVMLRSCGLLRDEMKWPNRDRRLKRKMPLFDRISFQVLNPFTVGTMKQAISTIEELLTRPADDDLYVRYKGMKFTRAALERAKTLYTLAIYKYLSRTLPDKKFPEKKEGEKIEWVDLGGEILPRHLLKRSLETDSIPAAEEIFAEAFERYHEFELVWIAQEFGDKWREREDQISIRAQGFDDMVEEDRQHYLQMLSHETRMLSL